MKNNKIIGNINQIINIIAPIIIVPKIEINPIIIANNLILKPKIREIKLKLSVSKKFLMENPRPYLVTSRRQGENRVLKSKEIE